MNADAGQRILNKMVFNAYRFITIALLLICQDILKVFANVNLTVTPSNIVEVDEVVKMQCVFNSPQVSVRVLTGPTKDVLCILEHNASDVGKCKITMTNNICISQYNAACLDQNTYSIEVPITREWNEKDVQCQGYPHASNVVRIFVKVPVTSVVLTPTSVTVIAGQTMNLTCSTSFCDPEAHITWYKESNNITNHSTSKIYPNKNDLKNTTSLLQILVSKIDNRQLVYCTATNIPGRIINSTGHTIIMVLYKPELVSNTKSPYEVYEGHTATLECVVRDANPITDVTYRWFKTENPSKVLHNKPTYIIHNIARERSGFYNCTANNSVGTSEAVTVNLDVQYKPEVISRTSTPYIVIEGQTATLECVVTDANPNTSITYIWLNTSHPNDVLFKGPIYNISRVLREMSGLYNCTASNLVGTSEAASVEVTIQYPPTVYTLSQKDIKEGRNLSVPCQSSPGNPIHNNFYWTKVNNPGFRQNETTLQLPNIQRTSSGTYRCTAENIYYNGKKGRSNGTIDVNVLYHPIIEEKRHQIVNESDFVTLSLTITSNPLSNVTWYDNNELLSTQEKIISEMFTHNITSSFSVVSARCTDTKNFTVVTSNGIGGNVTDLVELIVNCKPKPDRNNITLGVTDQSEIEFSTTVISFPEPRYDLKYENGTTNMKMKDTLTRNAVNNFTIHFNQTIADHTDYGSYNLTIYNEFGETIVIVNVIPQRRPDRPRIVEVTCEETRTKVQWISSFNGGDRQTFTVIAVSGIYGISYSNRTSDEGENVIHMKYVENLHSSTEYVFYVSAQNQHGNKSSENITCKTLEIDSNDDLPIISGGAAAGGIALAIAITAVVILLKRYKKIEKSAKHIERFNNVNEEDDADVDGLKENSLYVSAGPRDGEKPEVVVYAAVAKKLPQSDNNSNLYADVKKSGRQHTIKGALSSEVKPKKGLFKKDEKAKHKKGKKPKNRPGEADVYENSEDIAMSTNVDNVYSNAGRKGLNKQEERGYKNKDGLLYVEVNFDGKQGQDNPVIHGEDEKTDYATVEFPMPSALHKASGSEEL